MSTGRLVAGVDCSTQAIKVVVVEPDSGEVVATGRSALIVLVRTFLSFSLEVELYGRWPWQRAADETGLPVVLHAGRRRLSARRPSPARSAIAPWAACHFPICMLSGGPR